jgi:hypothetical protein
MNNSVSSIMRRQIHRRTKWLLMTFHED